MKIATWNVERLRHKKQLDQIQGLCDGIHADILVLTETDKRLHPDYAFCCETTSLMGDKTIPYAVTENRVSLYTNYPVVRLHQTYDSRTALCAGVWDNHRYAGQSSFFLHGTTAPAV